MLEIDIETLQAIDMLSSAPEQEVDVYFQNVVTYTTDNYLARDGVSNIETSTSKEGYYGISNVTITLRNVDYDLSRFYADELPIGRLVIIYDIINSTRVECFRGKITDWKLTPEIVTLTVTA